MKTRNLLGKLNAPTGVRSMRWLCGWTVVETLVVLAIAALLAVIIWSVCVEIHSHTLKHGVVIGKHHDAAWVQTTMMVISDGKTTTVIPQTTYWPETWNVTMEGTNSSGEQLTRNLSLEKSEYEEIKIGQRINAD